MTTKPTIVLVPGAWHFPSCYDILAERLHAKGYSTQRVAHASVYKAGSEAPKLSGLKDDADAVRNVVLPLVEAGKEVVVLCHSYGGYPTTEGLAGLGKAKQTNAQAGGVVHIIYLAAFVGKEGVAQITMNMNNPDGWEGTWISFSEDMSRSWVNKEHAVRALYADVPPEMAEKMVGLLGDMVGAPVVTPLEHCAWREIPCTYILCEQDKAIFANFQERMAKDAGITDIVRLNSSHSPFLSQPDQLVRIVDRVIEQKNSEST